MPLLKEKIEISQTMPFIEFLDNLVILFNAHEIDSKEIDVYLSQDAFDFMSNKVKNEIKFKAKSKVPLRLKRIKSIRICKNNKNINFILMSLPTIRYMRCINEDTKEFIDIGICY